VNATIDGVVRAPSAVFQITRGLPAIHRWQRKGCLYRAIPINFSHFQILILQAMEKRDRCGTCARYMIALQNSCTGLSGVV